MVALYVLGRHWTLVQLINSVHETIQVIILSKSFNKSALESEISLFNLPKSYYSVLP